MANEKKIAGLSALQYLVNKCKEIFATKTEVDESVAQKSQVQLINVNESDTITEIMSTLKIHKLSKEKYDEELVNGNIDETALYLTPDDDVDLSLYATIEQLNDKADIEHSHKIVDVANLQTFLDEIDNNLSEKVPASRTVNGKSLSTDIILSASDIGALPDTTNIPDALSDLSSDSTHRTVTDEEKATWNNKSEFSGDYNDLLNKPIIPSISGLATEIYADNASTTAANKVKNDLLNNAGSAYDTLKELGDLIDDNTDAIDALEIIAVSKADLEHTHSYDDLRNKPFYEGVDFSSIFASTVNLYEWGGGVYGAAVVDAPKVFAQDVSYKVIWDGVEYTVTSAYAGDNESGNPIISIGAPYGDYSIYPFGIDSYQTSSGTYEYSIHTNSTDAAHTIDILELGSSFVTLDDRFVSDNIARTIYVDEAIAQKTQVQIITWESDD